MKVTPINLDQSVIRLIRISIFIIIVILVAIGPAEFIPNVASQPSSSPSFAHQEIMDGYETLVDANTQDPVDDVDRINILSVDYLSNSRFLNATLWLAYPISKSIQPDAKSRMYGMLIDADLNNQT